MKLRSESVLMSVRTISFSIGVAVALATAGNAEAGRAYSALMAESPANRDALFAEVITVNNLACSSVRQSLYLGEADNADFWTVRCGEGDFVIAVENSSSDGMATKVRACSDAQSIGVECWNPLLLSSTRYLGRDSAE